MRAVKLRPWQVQKQVQALIRSYGSTTAVIERARRTFSELKQQRMVMDTVYRGEALFVPASGDVAIFGLGQVENKQPVLIVAGKRDIQQGDFVTHEKRRYQVEFEPTYFEAYTLLKLKQWEQ